MAKQLVTFRAPADLIARINELASSNNTTRTGTIIFALEYLLEKVEDN